MNGFSVILAADRQMGIGQNGTLPWHLPGDMAAFRELTTGEGEVPNAVIMGRKTWESIPDKFRPLPGRINIVMTSQEDLPLPEGVRRASGLDQALEQALDAGTVFVIGGGAVYKEAFEHQDCSTVYLTRIDANLDCDTHVPELPERFILDSTSGNHTENEITFRFEVYQLASAQQDV